MLAAWDTRRVRGLRVFLQVGGRRPVARREPQDQVAGGTLRGIQTCAPLIKDSGGGSVVNIGSVAGITGNFGTGYSSSKWALEGLSRSAAYVFADWGIRCNVIQPGWIETDLTAAMSATP
jgi:NAD(P)-dependent dehydrogenase (short-subunit alcohol dehydrogenase family)